MEQSKGLMSTIKNKFVLMTKQRETDAEKCEYFNLMLLLKKANRRK